jgi:hypothetical protein
MFCRLRMNSFITLLRLTQGKKKDFSFQNIVMTNDDINAHLGYMKPYRIKTLILQPNKILFLAQ